MTINHLWLKLRFGTKGEYLPFALVNIYMMKGVDKTYTYHLCVLDVFIINIIKLNTFRSPALQ